ncbi:MAG: hypothetical protein ACKOSS_03670 [Planctomycetia bacterium]
MAADDTGTRQRSDPLKWYCVLFALMDVLLLLLYVGRRGDLAALEAANAQARTWFNPNLARNTLDDRANDIPGLAFEVEQLVQAYVDAGGAEASIISESKMKQIATRSGMTELKLGGEINDPNKGRGFTTLTRTFEYAAGASLENLVTLAYNVDNSQRYRVMELSWELMGRADGNDKPPFHKIGRSSVKVALRKALPKN